MKALIVAAAAIGLLFGISSADAKGCLKGAAVGGAAGHFAGHHGVLWGSSRLRHRSPPSEQGCEAAAKSAAANDGFCAEQVNSLPLHAPVVFAWTVQ